LSYHSLAALWKSPLELPINVLRSDENATNGERIDMSRILIAGASRGIGLELAKQLAENGDDVVACVRSAAEAKLLDEVAKGAANISVEEMDLGDAASIDAAAAKISGALDAVLVVAGAKGGEAQSIDDVDIEEWHRSLDINTIGPLLVARAFKPHLVESGDGKLMILTSQLAASTWPMGGMYIYSTTKAGVSKVGQNLALDWKEDPITIALMHPGWVKTDMGGPYADLPVEDSASGIISVLSGLTKKDSGKFFKWTGEAHPW
jgi:NAD(P)-dependent dehydrogenase (short-subunit alcohol dehydrogenase family)